MQKSPFSEKNLQAIINAIPIGVLLVDMNNKIVFSNSKVEELFGFNENELLGLSVHNLIPKRFQEAHSKMIASFRSSPLVRPMSSGRMLMAVTKNRHEISVQIGISPIIIEQNDYVVLSMIEATNPVLKVASYNDPLTGLANRTLFNEVSENLRHLAIRNNVFLALMFIDLDDFKNVNDLCGHDIGDFVLRKVADICFNNVRTNDIVARIGGDEFLVCLYGIENNGQLEDISNKLIKEISSIKNIKNHTITIGASIGALLFTTPASLPIDDMINMADKLMYKAKNDGKGKVFTQEY